MTDIDLTEEQIDAMERKLLGYQSRPILVETRRRRGPRAKMDGTVLAAASPEVPARQRKSRRVTTTYEFYEYSPEYGAPYWRINEIQGGRSELFRKCETKTQCLAVVDHLRRSGAQVRDCTIRRAGELLKQIEPQKGARTDLQPTDGGDSKLTRTEAARQAGMSERQQVTAIRVANVPKEEFERHVEELRRRVKELLK